MLCIYQTRFCVFDIEKLLDGEYGKKLNPIPEFGRSWPVSMDSCDLQIRDWLKTTNFAHQYFHSCEYSVTLVKHSLSCCGDREKKVLMMCTREQLKIWGELIPIKLPASAQIDVPPLVLLLQGLCVLSLLSTLWPMSPASFLSTEGCITPQVRALIVSVLLCLLSSSKEGIRIGYHVASRSGVMT